MLDAALSNPVLPKTVISCVESLSGELHSSLIRTSDDLELVARDLPRHYPTLESTRQADLTWANNQINERGDKLYASYLQLCREIRKYLQSDNLIG